MAGLLSLMPSALGGRRFVGDSQTSPPRRCAPRFERLRHWRGPSVLAELFTKLDEIEGPNAERPVVTAAGHTAIQPSIGVGRGFDNKGYRGHQGWPESGSLPRFLGVFLGSITRGRGHGRDVGSHHQPPLHQGRLQARELVADLDPSGLARKRLAPSVLEVFLGSITRGRGHGRDDFPLPPDQTQSNVVARGSAKLQSARPPLFLGGEIMESSGSSARTLRGAWPTLSCWRWH